MYCVRCQRKHFYRYYQLDHVKEEKIYRKCKRKETRMNRIYFTKMVVRQLKYEPTKLLYVNRHEQALIPDHKKNYFDLIGKDVVRFMTRYLLRNDLQPFRVNWSLYEMTKPITVAKYHRTPFDHSYKWIQYFYMTMNQAQRMVRKKRRRHYLAYNGHMGVSVKCHACKGFNFMSIEHDTFNHEAISFNFQPAFCQCRKLCAAFPLLK